MSGPGRDEAGLNEMGGDEMGMIYLDHQASTPCDARVVAAMLPYFTRHFANPHSEEHAAGRAARDAVEDARAQVAALIGASPREIIFTSGATEANNLALKGAVRYLAGQGVGARALSFAHEHKCVLETLRALHAAGEAAVAFLPVSAGGQPDLAALATSLADQSAGPVHLVSAMAANNETGVCADLAAIGALCAQAGVLLHSDLAQAAGKIPLDMGRLGIGLASLSAHKIYGPKGVGALYVRQRPRARISPLFSGGGQERGLRPGTLPVPLIVGFGEACRIAREAMAAEAARLEGLRAQAWQGLSAVIPGLACSTGNLPIVPGTLHLRLPRHRALDLIAACPDVAISTGSACSSAELAPSHVLTAMGLDAQAASRCLRLCPGRTTAPEDIARAVRRLGEAWQVLESGAAPAQTA